MILLGLIVRPVATALLMIAILLVERGVHVASGFRLPQVDYPTMQVVTFYPGANPR